MIRVLLADDHPLVRTGLRATMVGELGMLLVGEAADGNEARHLARELQPDVLLLDVSMPGPPAVETVRAVRRAAPRTQILILTAYKDPGLVRGLLAAGVAGYLLKDETNAAIVDAVRVAATGGSWISAAIVAELAHHERRPADLPKPELTDLESSVLRLLIAGKGDQEIALALDVAERTVRRHLRNIYDKLGAACRVEAAVRAIQFGLVVVPPIG